MYCVWMVKKVEIEKCVLKIVVYGWKMVVEVLVGKLCIEVGVKEEVVWFVFDEVGCCVCFDVLMKIELFDL